MKFNLVKLKIKSKTLAEEARIIRHEERKFGGWERETLAYHRRRIVRDEARATQLAIAFIKGQPYHTRENTCKDTVYRDLYIVPKVFKMARKYGDNPQVMKDDILEWVNDRDRKTEEGDSQAEAAA